MLLVDATNYISDATIAVVIELTLHGAALTAFPGVVPFLLPPTATFAPLSPAHFVEHRPNDASRSDVETWRNRLLQ